MEKVTSDVLAILRNSSLSPDQKREQVRKIAEDRINFYIMARLCLGRPWRDITDAQRTQYCDEFKQHIISTYGHTTDDYADQDVTVIGDHPESDGDWTVRTDIVGSKDGGPRKKVAKVDYRLRKQENEWKVIDFTIDGVSLIANFRSQFQEIMSNGGINELIKRLHDKNVANEK